MKCEIIRDLFPSYIDGLTSEESNRAIEEHLYQCDECQEILDGMRKDMKSPELIAANKKNIKPFKKMKRAVWKAVGITIVICALLLGGAGYYFSQEWSPKAEEVKETMSRDGQIITIKFASKDKNVYLTAEADADDPHLVSIKAKRINPLSRPLRINGYYGFTFIDQDTVMTSDGGQRKLSDEENLKIQYADHTEEINMKELAGIAMEK